MTACVWQGGTQAGWVRQSEKRKSLRSWEATMLAGWSTLILYCLYRMGGNAVGMKTVSVTSRKLTDVPGSLQMKTTGMWGDPCINRVSGVID